MFRFHIPAEHKNHLHNRVKNDIQFPQKAVPSSYKTGLSLGTNDTLISILTSWRSDRNGRNDKAYNPSDSFSFDARQSHQVSALILLLFSISKDRSIHKWEQGPDICLRSCNNAAHIFKTGRLVCRILLRSHSVLLRRSFPSPKCCLRP